MPLILGYGASGQLKATIPNGSMSERAISRFIAKKSAALPILNFAGDSYCAGAGATGSVGYSQKLTLDLAAAAQISNYGYAGFPLSMYSRAPRIAGAGATNASQIAILPTTITDVVVGLNDLRGVGQAGGNDTRGCGPDPSNSADLRGKVMAMATHFLIPEVNKVRATNAAQDDFNPALTRTGPWIVGAAGVIYSTGGGTISGTTAFGNLLVLKIDRDSSEDNYWTLVVDGVTYPTITCRAAYDTWSNDCVIIPLPTRAVHTFTLTATIVSGDGAHIFSSVDVVDTLTDFSATLQYSTPIFLNDGTNIGWGFTANSANSASVALATGALAWQYGNGGCLRFSAQIDAAMMTLYELGFNIVKSDVLTGWEKSMHLYTDTLHPNDGGHGVFYNAKRPFLRRLLIDKE